jgi:sterol carrier protein 2
VYEPLTKLQCCPTSDGAGAAILASEDFVAKHRPQAKAVEIAGMAMTTDLKSTFDEKSCIKLVGSTSPAGGREGLRAVGPRPEDVDGRRAARLLLVQRADHLRGARLCAAGKGGELIDSGADTYGGKVGRQPVGG